MHALFFPVTEMMLVFTIGNVLNCLKFCLFSSKKIFFKIETSAPLSINALQLIFPKFTFMTGEYILFLTIGLFSSRYMLSSNKLFNMNSSQEKRANGSYLWLFGLLSVFSRSCLLNAPLSSES